MKIFVHTLAKSKETLRGGATLVFETIRTGFPKADIWVIDGGSNKELIPAIQAAVGKVDGQFLEFRHGERHQGGAIWDILRKETEPCVFVDPDVIFWEEMTIPDHCLWAGAHCDPFQIGGVYTLEKPDSSLLMFPDPKAFVAEWEKRTKTWFYQNPFDGQTFAEAGVVKRLEVGAIAYSIMKDVFHPFGAAELNKYDHLHSGSYQNTLDSFDFGEEINAEIRRPYFALEKFGIESLRGISRYRDIQRQGFAWAYASGKLGKYAVSFAHFGSFAHVGLLNTETGEFNSGSSWMSSEEMAVEMPFGKIKLDCRLGKMKAAMEQRPGLCFSMRAIDTDVPATLTVNDESAKGCVWFEVERGIMPIGMGWLWISLRLNNGERLCRYDFDKWSNDQKEWSVGKYTVRNMGHRIKDTTAWGIEYTESFCPVYEGDEIVGHAFLEFVRPGWKGFPHEFAMQAKFNEWGNYNKDAAELLKMLHRISQLADDIADGEARGPVPVANFGLAALMELHSNPFYVEHQATIDPMILASMRFWEVSDEWAKSTNKRTRIFAYAFRESFRIVSWWVATLAGGDSHGRRVLRDMHEFFSVPGGVESFEAWDREQANAGLR